MAQPEKKQNLKDRVLNYATSLFFESKGKLKSTVVLYSFCLALLECVIYVLSYLLLLPSLDRMAAGWPVPLASAAEILIPALAGTAVCLLVGLLCRKNRDIPVISYLWLGALLLISMIVMAFLADWSDGPDDYEFFLFLLVLPSACSILTGWIGAFLVRKKVR